MCAFECESRRIDLIVHACVPVCGFLLRLIMSSIKLDPIENVFVRRMSKWQHKFMQPSVVKLASTTSMTKESTNMNAKLSWTSWLSQATQIIWALEALSFHYELLLLLLQQRAVATSRSSLEIECWLLPNWMKMFKKWSGEKDDWRTFVKSEIV